MHLETMFTATLAIVGTMAGGMIWMLKALMARIEARDEVIRIALDNLAKAVAAFGRIETREEESHRMIIEMIGAIGKNAAEDRLKTLELLKGITDTQREILTMVAAD